MWLSDVAIKRPVFITMVILSIVVFGYIALNRIGVDLFPKVDFPVIAVQVALPGADPETIENTVSQPIEEAISGVSGIDEVQSTSAEGVSTVTIQFELEKNIDVAFQDVQSRLSALKGQLPDDASEPVVLKFDADAAAILAVAFDSKIPIGQFTETVDKLVKQRLEKIQNVGQVTILGGRKRKIWLNLDRDKLAGYGLAVADVVDALRREHVEVPGGRLVTGATEYVVKTRAEFTKLEEFQNMTISWIGGAAVRLSDVGEVQDDLEELTSMARVGGRRALAVQVQKQSGSNTVAVALAVKKELDLLKPILEGKGIQMNLVQDQSVYIAESVSEVQHHLVVGGLFAVIVVFIFLRNIRSTFIAALVLPTSILGAFLAIYAMGFTQNFMTLLALSLAIGLLIDDAIVVQENIMHHVENGMPAREAASLATKEIALAVLATTLCVVAVFVPVAFTTGFVGRFFFQFGLTVAFAVLISMFVSFTLDPMFSSRILVKPKKGLAYRWSEAPFVWMENAYRTTLKGAIWGRWIIAPLVFVAAMMLTGMLGKGIRSEFVPTDDQSEFNINVYAPLGSSVRSTDAQIEQVRRLMEKEPWVELMYATVGSGRKSNEGSLYVKMKDIHHRTVGQVQAMEIARNKVKELSGLKTSVEVVPRFGGGGRFAMVTVGVRGPNLDKLDQMTQSVLKQMEKAGGYVDLDTNFKKGKPQAAVIIDRNKASDLGVSPIQVALTVRALLSGEDVARFRQAGERYDVAVRLAPSNRTDPMDLKNVGIRNVRGKIVSLESVARVLPESAPSEILRYNRQRQIVIYANFSVNKDGGGKVLSDAQKEMTEFMKKAGVSGEYVYEDQGMGKNMGESFAALGFSLLLAVVVVYMVLAAQFESFTQPIVIMLSLPLSIVGAFAALAITQKTMSIYVMIGIIMLMGLVTKNGIMLVDLANTLIREKGYSLRDALLEAGPRRLRPILMTSVAMIAGMWPIAMGEGAGAASRGPMATSIIGGLITSTLLTLLIVPQAYAMLMDIQDLPRRIKLWFQTRSGKTIQPSEPVIQDQPATQP